MKKVSMKKVSEVLRFHFKLELSIRQSANAANVSRSTASDYCKRFKELGISINSFISLDEIQQEDLFFPKKIQVYNNTKSRLNEIYLLLNKKRYMVLVRIIFCQMIINYQLILWVTLLVLLL